MHWRSDGTGTETEFNESSWAVLLMPPLVAFVVVALSVVLFVINKGY